MTGPISFGASPHRQGRDRGVGHSGPNIWACLASIHLLAHQGEMARRLSPAEAIYCILAATISPPNIPDTSSTQTALAPSLIVDVVRLSPFRFLPANALGTSGSCQCLSTCWRCRLSRFGSWSGGLSWAPYTFPAQVGQTEGYMTVYRTYHYWQRLFF